MQQYCWRRAKSLQLQEPAAAADCCQTEAVRQHDRCTHALWSAKELLRGWSSKSIILRDYCMVWKGQALAKSLVTMYITYARAHFKVLPTAEMHKIINKTTDRVHDKICFENNKMTWYCMLITFVQELVFCPLRQNMYVRPFTCIQVA